MAQNVVGLDLGSHSVKAVVLRIGLRTREVTRFDAEPVELDESGRSSPEAVWEAAGRLVRRLGVRDETIYCAVCGEHATLRSLELPVSAGRRLEQVLGFELDESLPYDIEGAVFDHIELGREGDRMRLLAAVVPAARVGEVISGLAEHDVDPREVAVAPLAYRADFEQPRDGEPEVTAVVDIGHQRTNVAVLCDEVVTARTILRGGRDLTARLAAEGEVSFEEAERHKIRSGLSGRVGEILKDALRPLLREIRQTATGHLAAGGKRVSRVLLCGGSSRLAGLDQLIADEIGLPVELHEAPVGGLMKSLESGLDGRLAVLGHGLARSEELQRSRRVNVRRGTLAFKGDYTFLRRRLIWIAACVMAVIFAWIFASYAEYAVLESEAEKQRERIAQMTEKLFGKPISDQQEIIDQLGGGEAETLPMPDYDAFDLVVELSRRIPKSVVHDVERLEIKPKRLSMKAIVDSELTSASPDAGVSEFGMEDGGLDDTMEVIEPTDLIRQQLAGFEACFKDIRIGKVQTVNERKRYQMEIDSKCP
ncbi:MAG: pilus assembly protein PilM [Polyangia bacterium]